MVSADRQRSLERQIRPAQPLGDLSSGFHAAARQNLPTAAVCFSPPQPAGKAGWEQKPASQSVYVGERQSWDAACSEGVKSKKRVKSFELPLGVGGIRLRAVFMFVVEVGESPVPLFLVK